MLKTFKSGTHRALSPQATFDRIKDTLPDFGITRVANITGLDRLNVPVFMVCRPNAASLAVFQGKGMTPEAAKVSGIMESIECFHAEYTDLAPVMQSYSDACKSGAAIDIHRLARLQGQDVCEQMDMAWVQGVNLLDGRAIAVPFSCVHINCTTQSEPASTPFITDTNGLASGNTMIEAQNHALCELIERDALALWAHRTRVEKQKRKIRLETIADERIRDIIERAHDLGLGVGIWDVSSDLGIPTFLCKIFGCDYYPDGARPALGSGTHPAKDVALMRAVTEAAQSRLTFISGARDDQYMARYREQITQENHARWHSEIIAMPESMDYADVPELAFDTFEDDQQALCQSIHAAGIDQIACVDLSQEKFDIPVVKIVTPGLEGISFSGRRILGPRGRQAYFSARDNLHA